MIKTFSKETVETAKDLIREGGILRDAYHDGTGYDFFGALAVAMHPELKGAVYLDLMRSFESPQRELWSETIHEIQIEYIGWQTSDMLISLLDITDLEVQDALDIMDMFTV